MAVEEVSIRDEVIRLGQLLKFANLVSTGGEAKLRIQNGEVLVNGEIDTRRGRQLRDGDRVQLGDQEVVIRSSAGA